MRSPSLPDLADGNTTVIQILRGFASTMLRPQLIPSTAAGVLSPSSVCVSSTCLISLPMTNKPPSTHSSCQSGVPPLPSSCFNSLPILVRRYTWAFSVELSRCAFSFCSLTWRTHSLGVLFVELIVPPGKQGSYLDLMLVSPFMTSSLPDI